MPPTADHYVKHMMYHAQVGTLGETLGALLPCPWTYLEIGQYLIETFRPAKDHPFYQWITFYADVGETTENLRNWLDKQAADASGAEILRIKDAFRKSCQLELAFWEMALTCEDWPSGKAVSSR